VQDLTWKNLMDAYSCTECGRCTASCPANLTGKKLSPRKIMMATRDRMEDIGNNVKLHGEGYDDGKSLYGDYISKEELLACTTCNACVDACPININPLEIIVELRRYAAMEESSMPASWNMMSANIENNGAPWAFPTSDRFNWATELMDKG
jgi:Fe-S oxidoreductase